MRENGSESDSGTDEKLEAVREATSTGQQIKIARLTARIALWTTVGLVLSGVERLIPTPLPWIKLGLANGAALIVLYKMGWGAAMTVNLLRVIAVALLLGSWSNPSFLLSLSGAVVAVPVMAVTRSVARGWIGPVGVSAVGAWMHMLAQFVLASVLIVRHGSLFVMAGPSLIAAVISGIMIGWLAGEIIRRLPESLSV